MVGKIELKLNAEEMKNAVQQYVSTLMPAESLRITDVKDVNGSFVISLARGDEDDKKNPETKS